MASITIRRLGDKVKVKLQKRAACHGRSMEAEAREILTARSSEKDAPQESLGTAIRRYFDRLVGLNSIFRRASPSGSPEL